MFGWIVMTSRGCLDCEMKTSQLDWHEEDKRQNGWWAKRWRNRDEKAERDEREGRRMESSGWFSLLSATSFQSIIFLDAEKKKLNYFFSLARDDCFWSILHLLDPQSISWRFSYEFLAVISVKLTKRWRNRKKGGMDPSTMKETHQKEGQWKRWIQ